MTFSGRCQCGAIRYEISSEPIVAYCCHCTDCQQQSSSAFGMSVWFSTDTFRLTDGALSTWKTRGDSGNEKSCALCPDCGTRIYHAFVDEPEIISVKGGSLDEVCKISPVAHIWTRSAQPWVSRLIVDEVCYETEPDNFDDIVHNFRIRSE
jgi:hypothetical protein